MSAFYLVNAIPFIFAIFVPFIHKKLNPRIHTGWTVLLIPLVIFIFLLSYIPQISSGKSVYLTLLWIPAYDLNLTAIIDGLSLTFGLIISGMGFLVILYSIFYMSKTKEALHNFYIYILIFMGAMLGVVFSDNIFGLYVFWEITSISSFLLIAYWFERDKSRSGALKALLITVFGGLSMLAGLIMLSIMTGTYSIQEMIGKVDLIQAHSLFIPAMVLILLGAFAKSAQFPFSIWLPDAMEAPTPISAYLHSATMVKAGIYLVARFTAIFAGGAIWFWLLMGVGLVTLVYGAINAIRQVDLKAMLAYSTISQLGLIMSLLGLGSASLYFDSPNSGAIYTVAIIAAIFHLVNHSTFKGGLFMVIGVIDHELGTRDIRKLGGLLYLMPVSFLLTLMGSFSMAGIPPFNGFLSKELFFTSFINGTNMDFFGMGTWGYILVVIIWLASILTFIYCMIIVFKTFLGEKKTDKLKKKPHEAPIGLLISPLVLATLILLIFINPNVLVQNLLVPAWNAILPTFADTSLLQIDIKAWHGFTPELIMTIGVIIIGSLLYKYYDSWNKIYRYYPQSLTLNNLYVLSLEKMEAASLAITERYMTGSLRDYLVYIFGFVILLVGGAILLFDSVSLNFARNAEISFFEVGFLLCLVVTAVFVLLAKTRLGSLIALGGLGFLVVFIFVLFRAPDLALTQLVVETVTITLFLLCFYHLPKLKKEIRPLSKKVVNGIISVGMGLVMTIVAISSFGNRSFEPISDIYEGAYELAGAKNIVNAILVDFRGFDTMLEILVLFIAGLGVYTLIKLDMSRRRENEED